MTSTAVTGCAAAEEQPKEGRVLVLGLPSGCTPKQRGAWERGAGGSRVACGGHTGASTQLLLRLHPCAARREMSGLGLAQGTGYNSCTERKAQQGMRKSRDLPSLAEVGTQRKRPFSASLNEAIAPFCVIL